MYKVFKVVKTEDKKSQSISIGEVVDRETAIKRARRMGGYAIDVASRRLLIQTLIPRGPNFMPPLTCIASGEDAHEDY